MANFYKEEGMDSAGYDPSLNRQSLGAGQSSKIALFGGDTDGSPLKVTSSKPGVIDLDDQGAQNPNVRVLRIIGRLPGITMIEARTKVGAILAFMHVQVTSLSREQRVSEAMRRAIPLLPHAAKEAIEPMLSPESIIIIAGSLLLWAGSHVFGVGEIVDIILMVGGFFMLGKSVFDLAEDLFKFAKLTVMGTSDAELEEAAKCFARVVVIGGIDLVMALLLRKNLKEVRARPRVALAPKGLLPVEPAPPMNPGELFYKPKISRPVTLPNGSLGECSWYGDVYVTRAQTFGEQRATLFHELGHSYFSPKFKYLRQFRARLKASAYWRSALLRYLEEALVEGFGRFKEYGLLPALRAVTFPIGPAPYGYVTVSQLATEGIALGTIVISGLNLRVFLSKAPPQGMPPTTVR